MTTKVNNRMIDEAVWSNAVLSSITSEPNLDKWVGKQVFVTDTNQPAYSTGTLDVSPWVDAQGTILITPS